MNESLENLMEAEKKALLLFQEIEKRKLVLAGNNEKELNDAVYKLAFEMFGIKKYWHKRIVRAGANTLLPYRENPPTLLLKENDILFFDFGPVFDDWEADVGKTYVLGNDARKLKLKDDVALAWYEGKAYYEKHKDTITGADFYNYTYKLAEKYGWKYGNEHCGHLIGNFPHENIYGEEVVNYIHPNNHIAMQSPAENGRQRYWIYEIHFIDPVDEIGGFFEQLLS